ncbi:hypothetical protein FACS1894153_2590 [Bacteroidia bacterium]|nr:hypothetical protein FACS1894153_2590 [Bacteroidia bacterium]
MSEIKSFVPTGIDRRHLPITTNIGECEVMHNLRAVDDHIEKIQFHKIEQICRLETSENVVKMTFVDKNNLYIIAFTNEIVIVQENGTKTILGVLSSGETYRDMAIMEGCIVALSNNKIYRYKYEVKEDNTIISNVIENPILTAKINITEQKSGYATNVGDITAKINNLKEENYFIGFSFMQIFLKTFDNNYISASNIMIANCGEIYKNLITETDGKYAIIGNKIKLSLSISGNDYDSINTYFQDKTVKEFVLASTRRILPYKISNNNLELLPNDDYFVQMFGKDHLIGTEEEELFTPFFQIKTFKSNEFENDSNNKIISIEYEISNEDIGEDISTNPYIDINYPLSQDDLANSLEIIDNQLYLLQYGTKTKEQSIINAPIELSKDLSSIPVQSYKTALQSTKSNENLNKYIDEYMEYVFQKGWFNIEEFNNIGAGHYIYLQNLKLASGGDTPIEYTTKKIFIDTPAMFSKTCGNIYQKRFENVTVKATYMDDTTEISIVNMPVVGLIDDNYENVYGNQNMPVFNITNYTLNDFNAQMFDIPNFDKNKTNYYKIKGKILLTQLSGIINSIYFSIEGNEIYYIKQLEIANIGDFEEIYFDQYIPSNLTNELKVGLHCQFSSQSQSDNITAKLLLTNERVYSDIIMSGGEPVHDKEYFNIFAENHQHYDTNNVLFSAIENNINEININGKAIILFEEEDYQEISQIGDVKTLFLSEQFKNIRDKYKKPIFDLLYKDSIFFEENNTLGQFFHQTFNVHTFQNNIIYEYLKNMSKSFANDYIILPATLSILSTKGLKKIKIYRKDGKPLYFSEDYILTISSANISTDVLLSKSDEDYIDENISPLPTIFPERISFSNSFITAVPLCNTLVKELSDNTFSSDDSYIIDELNEYNEGPIYEQISNVATNRLQLSAFGNPFIMPYNYSYRFGKDDNKLIHLEPITGIIPYQEFGMFPFYMFATDGVWITQKGNADTDGSVIIASKFKFSEQVLNNPNSVTQTPIGVTFATDNGIYVIQSQDIKEISLQLKPVSIVKDIRKDNWINPLNNKNFFAVFDKYHNEILFIANNTPDKSLCLIYNLRLMNWYTRSLSGLYNGGAIDGTRGKFWLNCLSEYNERMLISNDPERDYDTLSNLNYISNNSKTSDIPLLLSAGFSLTPNARTHISQILYRGFVRLEENTIDGSSVLQLLGSYDGINWAIIKNISANNINTISDYINNLFRLGRINRSYLFYKLQLIGADLNTLSTIDVADMLLTSIDLVYDNQYINKIR